MSAPRIGIGLGQGYVFFAVGIAVLLALGGGSVAQGQTRPTDSLSLVQRYRMARVHVLAQEYISGRRSLPVLPTEDFPIRIDVLPDTSASGPSGISGRREDPSFEIDEVRRVRSLERTWFRNQYADVQWSYLGAGIQLTFFDTTRTRDLRARLQAQFGDPTRTLSEVYSNEWATTPDSNREASIQFEYWFIVNDSLPVRVSDVDGPGARGLIFSTDRANRERIEALRASLLDPLRREERAPYVDYYYNEETQRWYRVGFDGQSFFRERISRFDIVPGRRPHLDTIEAESAPEDALEGSPSSSP